MRGVSYVGGTKANYSYTMDPTHQARAYARANRDAFLDGLRALLRIPSVSTDPAYADDVRRAADTLAAELRQLGAADARAVPTTGHPIVMGSVQVDDRVPTVLVYGHYDVQPADPLELWDSPPFEPVIRDGALYARGACDDKGQMYMHLKALESWVRTSGRPPVNLKFLLEGEEESGSASLPGFIEAHANELASDVVVISDTSLFAPGVPSITYGLRAWPMWSSR